MTTAAPQLSGRWPPSVIALILANAVPLVGVLAHHWTVFFVVLVYWCENVIVGVFNVLRMLSSRAVDSTLKTGKAFVIPFFIFHYGMFTTVHGVFVFSLFGRGVAPWDALRQAGVRGALVALLVSHGFSFFHNYLAGGEYRRVGLAELMALPYVRVVVLHLTILGGGFLVMALGSPLAALVILIVLKTAIDLRAHLAERTRLGGEALRLT